MGYLLSPREPPYRHRYWNLLSGALSRFMFAVKEFGTFTVELFQISNFIRFQIETSSCKYLLYRLLEGIHIRSD